MKNLLVGNGINIQFDSINYTAQQIVLRALKNCDREDFPRHIIVNEPYLMKNYFAKLYLAAREIINGDYDSYVNCKAEKKSLDSFKKQYADKIESIRITDIGFEDYYLIHDLVCHRLGVINPEQYYIREAMKVAYFYSIYNDGQVNELYRKYPASFISYLKSFDNIFSTNYDNNIELATGNKVLHIHGQFDKKDDVYNPESFRNQLPDAPIESIDIDDNYYYLYSNALSTHCGEYKELQVNQNSLANDAVEKLFVAYETNEKVKEEIDSWTKDNNRLVCNLGFAIQAKANNKTLRFSENYHFDKLKNISGTIEVLGLSPWNDFHIFEAVDNSLVDMCLYYYYDKSQCDVILNLLPRLNAKGRLKFMSVKDFWRVQYEV